MEEGRLLQRNNKVFPMGVDGVIRNMGAEIFNACLGILSRPVWLERIVLLLNESLIPNCV